MAAPPDAAAAAAAAAADAAVGSATSAPVSKLSKDVLLLVFFSMFWPRLKNKEYFKVAVTFPCVRY